MKPGRAIHKGDLVQVEFDNLELPLTAAITNINYNRLLNSTIVDYKYVSTKNADLCIEEGKCEIQFIKRVIKSNDKLDYGNAR